MPLIQTGLQAGIGAIANGKAKKEQAKAPEGMPEAGGGGEAGAAKGPDGGGAAAQAPKEDPVDRFLGMLSSPNIKSIADIKNFRDQVLQKLPPDQKDNGTKKLNQAILQKLGIGQPGPNGSMTVNLTPQNQQILQQLGMQPDQVTGGAGQAGAQAGAQPQPAGAQPQAAGAMPQAAGAQPQAAPKLA